MQRNIRACLQEILYVVVLIEVFLVVFIFPIALVSRSTTVTRSNRAERYDDKRGNNGSRVAKPQSTNGASVLETPSFKVPPVGVSQVTSSDADLLSMQSFDITAEGNMLSCREIDKFSLDRPVGKGTTKYVYKSVVDGRPVAVKVVTEKVKDITACKSTKGVENLASCFQFANYKVLKEIALLQQLRHPTIAKLLGYCIRNEGPEKERVRLVMEYGKPVEIRTMRWPEKLQMALDLAELLHFLHRSPLGSLRIGDFKRDQFRIINDTLKLSDLDDLTTEKLSCTHPRNCFIMGRDMGVQCVDSECENFNTVANVKVAKERFFNAIFGRAPPTLRNEAIELLVALSSDNIDTQSLINRIVLLKSHYEQPD